MSPQGDARVPCRPTNLCFPQHPKPLNGKGRPRLRGDDVSENAAQARRRRFQTASVLQSAPFTTA
ncbi:hypothetical protein HMPREF9123_0004 [Neisseria bacilliformis ATCC BAA-1200]|uniref:Uncharacterized protein n=1 Tax=Neisseria bacilliformis ATCC BAA-1200 TaxID=888742 RepID=F2B8F1_9NEIS|nr:hypothetical protein HMPREF9123_0004 [Neisseria bacilliformis ATCC BAA-1200]